MGLMVRSVTPVSHISGPPATDKSKQSPCNDLLSCYVTALAPHLSKPCTMLSSCMLVVARTLNVPFFHISKSFRNSETVWPSRLAPFVSAHDAGLLISWPLIQMQGNYVVHMISKPLNVGDSGLRGLRLSCGAETD